jgi:hypothetical protein
MEAPKIEMDGLISRYNRSKRGFGDKWELFSVVSAVAEHGSVTVVVDRMPAELCREFDEFLVWLEEGLQQKNVLWHNLDPVSLETVHRLQAEMRRRPRPGCALTPPARPSPGAPPGSPHEEGRRQGARGTGTPWHAPCSVERLLPSLLSMERGDRGRGTAPASWAAVDPGWGQRSTTSRRLSGRSAG